MIARSTDDRLIAGVLGGFATHLGWSSTNLRIAYVGLSVLSAGFPGTVVYVLLWFLMPEAPHRPLTFRVDDPRSG